MLSADGFFSLNVQATDVDLMPWRYRVVVHASEALRKLSAGLPTLANCADSLYVSAARPN